MEEQEQQNAAEDKQTTSLVTISVMMSRLIWAIALGTGLFTLYIIFTCNLGFGRLGCTNLIFIINPWLYLLAPFYNIKVEIFSSFVGLFDLFYDIRSLDVRSLFDITLIINTLTKPILYFSANLLIWRILFYFYLLLSKNTEHRKKEHKILLSLFILSAVLLILAISVVALVSSSQKSESQREYDRNKQIFQTILSEETDVSLCDDVSDKHNKRSNKVRYKQACYFITALVDKNTNACEELWKDSDEMLCKEFVQSVNDNSLTTNECNTTAIIHEGRCYMYMSLYFQDTTICKNIDRTDNRYIFLTENLCSSYALFISN